MGLIPMPAMGRVPSESLRELKSLLQTVETPNPILNWLRECVHAEQTRRTMERRDGIPREALCPKFDCSWPPCAVGEALNRVRVLNLWVACPFAGAWLDELSMMLNALAKAWLDGLAADS